jgi:nitrogen fixation protein NifZ
MALRTSRSRTMSDISREDDGVEINLPPRFEMGERVVSRSLVRNDGTYNGMDIGVVLVQRGEVGFVRSIGTFLQQFYIYAVEFPGSGHQVGMRARELCTLDHLPDDVLAQLGRRAELLPALR